MVPLSQVEKEIFLREIGRVGTVSIAKQLAQVKSPEYFEEEQSCGYRTYTCLLLELEIHLADTEIDPLAKLIFEAIIKNEEKRGYIPEQIIKDNGSCVILANNKLGWYTQYWHKKDDKGDYVKVLSNFDDKVVLEKILDELKENKEFSPIF